MVIAGFPGNLEAGAFFIFVYDNYRTFTPECGRRGLGVGW
jgi:hypothetical protein